MRTFYFNTAMSILSGQRHLLKKLFPQSLDKVGKSIAVNYVLSPLNEYKCIYLPNERFRIIDTKSSLFLGPVDEKTKEIWPYILESAYIFLQVAERND